MVKLTSHIIITRADGKRLEWNGVHEVHIKRSLHTYEDTALLTLPSVCSVSYNGKRAPGVVTVNTLFNDGDRIEIRLGYDYQLQTEFKGFIKRRNLQMPLVVECEGYSWQLKRNKINNTWKRITVKDLLKQAVAGTDIDPDKIICTVDITLANLAASNATGADIIKKIHQETDNNLSIYFIAPDVLWCGLVYSPTAAGDDAFGLNRVNYRLGYNVIRDNSLKERVLEDNVLIQGYVKKTSTGQKLYGEGTVGVLGQVRKFKKFLNRIVEAAVLKTLAQEKQYRKNYVGYEGKIYGFLAPYCLPGWTANVTDSRYPEKNGIYIIEATEIIFGQNGARRQVEIGPKIGFAK